MNSVCCKVPNRAAALNAADAVNRIRIKYSSLANVTMTPLRAFPFVCHSLQELALCIVGICSSNILSAGIERACRLSATDDLRFG